ncbi:PAS domain-containing sensor histidine kinase [Flavihumibacter petaseus]|uniref:histidine kinase n=1 Tax=Flavihumibacter petaseus NBRC 106054 TaxID=1220578 RepID=A0A0E9MZG7_9BACT|nr:PAS domain-containing sensor histidine kinase [Flavihumibacter petaseus]GAO43142.1 putative two-component histidine kinase [Flavihumibacter petaseus NBRC 106054]
MAVAINKYTFLEGGGELGELVRNFDWSSTAVGSVEEWPPALRTTVGIILHSGFPMFLWWGDEMIQFYNDAYRPSLGENGKHPIALGQHARDCWPEIWEIIYPLIRKVRTTGESFFLEDQLVPIYRNGKIEDVYWTFSYSAVFDEDEIGGVLVVCHETTNKVETIRKLENAQIALQRSEVNLQNMIQQAPVAISILKGPDHIVEIANDRMFELWGKPRSQMMGKPVFDELVEARKEGFEALLDSVYQSGLTYTAYGAPVTLYRNGGTQLAYVHFVYEAFRDGEGNITGVMVVAVDVTQEMIVRQKLEQSENKIRSLVEGAPFPIGVYEGPEMTITMLNQAIMTVWGKGHDLIGKTYMEVLPELESQDIYPQLTNVFKTGKAFHARNQKVDLVVNGKPDSFFFNYSFTPLLDSRGNVYGILNTAADVTDLNLAKLQVEQSESNFRQMVKQAPVAMCILLGPDHVVELANDMMLELWGKPVESVMQRPIFEGLPDARNQGLEDLLDNVYQTGAPFVAYEMPVQLVRNGIAETVFQNFVYEPYRDANGVVIGVLAITNDVTPQVLARHKIEEIVQERTESLERKNAELSQFAYISSHDLQEPARKISIFIDALKNLLADSHDPKVNSYIEKISRSSSRMLALIRDVLSISQLSSHLEKFERVDLNELLADVITDYELMIQEKQCTIEVKGSLPVVEAIPIQMSQVFGNLISNALKFAKADEPLRIVISHRLLDAGEQVAAHLKPGIACSRIDFSDNGIGFQQDYANQIFNIFQRLHGRTEYAGNGIGLAMCKKIMENHNGQIFATATPGAGATFTLLLPHLLPAVPADQL